jgi:hypothetical protein|tara:strand:- start:176 stop:460 length:285 start_codon:yes stop_codon:yes gene_type:complete
MAITYEWNFNFDVNNSDNTVKTIHWRYNAVDGEYSSSVYGSCGGSEGMDFESMTKDDAIACVTENQSIEDVQSNLSAQIDKQKNPETISQTKEW